MKLLLIIKIHSIIFIIQLKLIIEEDFYNRLINIDSSSIINEYIDIKTFFYEIKRLLNKKIIREKTYYLVK